MCVFHYPRLTRSLLVSFVLYSFSLQLLHFHSILVHKYHVDFLRFRPSVVHPPRKFSKISRPRHSATMKLSHSLLFAAQVLSVLALPAPKEAEKAAGAAGAAGAGKGAAAGAGAGAGAATGEAKEGEENEIVQQGQFGQVIQLGGGNIKTDTNFPPGVSSI